jgi:cysteine-rich repeat protein
MSTFPNPWRNRRGPWVSPVAGFSVVDKNVNSAIFEAKGSLPLSTFVLTIPISMSKIPVMSQKLSVLAQKLVPKYWDLLSNSWLETGCKILHLTDTECAMSCMSFGMFAIEYNSDLFVCGDGVRDIVENCDDWNTVDGDGCDSRCQIEDGWTCQKGNYPADKLGYDLCKRVPCFAPYNCKSQGLCVSGDVCFCDPGFFGETCNDSLPIFLQLGSNYTWMQLPLYLDAGRDHENEPIFSFVVIRGGNTTLNVNGSTLAARVTVYKPDMFKERNVRTSDMSFVGTKSTSKVTFESIFVSNIFDIRLTTAGALIVNATGRIFLSYKLSLPPPFMNISLSNINSRNFKNGANLTVQINVCQYSVLNNVWQPIPDQIQHVYDERRVVFEFNAFSPNYYALIATARIDPVQPVVPAQLQNVEPEHSNLTAVLAGVVGGTLFLAALLALWYIRRRNRRRMVLAAYYQAATEAARKRKLKLAAISQPPFLQSHEGSDNGPQKKQQIQKTAVQHPQQQVAELLNQYPPPPVHGVSASKSLVAAAIRSKFKNSNRLTLGLPTIELNQDLEFELDDVTENLRSVVSHSSKNAEDLAIYSDADAIEVDSVDSDGKGEREMEALSSCSAISMAEHSESGDLEDAGMAPPAMLPLNDFEEDCDSLNLSTQARRSFLYLARGNSTLQPSLATEYAAKWKEQNSASFSA